MRLLEVRKAYAGGQFDFPGMHELAVAELVKENDKLMADYVKDSMRLPEDPAMGQTAWDTDEPVARVSGVS